MCFWDVSSAFTFLCSLDVVMMALFSQKSLNNTLRLNKLADKKSPLVSDELRNSSESIWWTIGMELWRVLRLVSIDTSGDKIGQITREAREQLWVEWIQVVFNLF